MRPGTLGKTYTAFADRFLRRHLIQVRTVHGQKRRVWKTLGPKKEALPFVEKLIEPFSLCRPKAEFGQALPEIVCDLRLVELPEKQRLFYRQVLLHYWPKLKKRDLKALASVGPLPPQDCVA